MNKRRIKLSESQLNRVITESVRRILNEGGGAGYELTIKGLNAGNISINKVDDEYAYFSAEILPGTVDDWTVEWYDDATYAGDYDKEVLGGSFEGCISLDSIIDKVNQRNCSYGIYTDGDAEIEEEDILDEIEYILDDFEVSDMLGRGWTFSRLGETIYFEDVEISRGYSCVVGNLKLNAPSISQSVNSYHDEEM